LIESTVAANSFAECHGLSANEFAATIFLKMVEQKKRLFRFEEVESFPNNGVVTSFLKKQWLLFRILGNLLFAAYRQTGSLKEAVAILKQLRAKKARIYGPNQSTKIFKVGGHYYYHLNAPGYPSLACHRMLENEVNKITKKSTVEGLRILFFGMTTKCPLNCEHCLEWDNLHQKEPLTDEELITLMHKFQDYRTTQIMWTGGEPLIRFKTLIRLLRAQKPGTDAWIITSGVSLTLEKAQALKRSGLTGVLVSLDHYIEEKHDQFRGYPGAYQSALKAVAYAQQAGLVTGLSICFTRRFTDEKNVKAYMRLARQLGVTFVQWLEAQAVGRYAGKDVGLRTDQQALLNDLYEMYNAGKGYEKYPIVEYVYYAQRRVGCLGAGAQYLYLDTLGEVQVCPFCREKNVDARLHDVPQIMEAIREGRCPNF
jgi:MoaA/NifB/PqqE/SkfB family radical SAM enzyme